MPKISVLVPTYNSSKFVAATLDSVLAQTEQDYELVICDDGSTDGTQDLVRTYVARDSRVSFVQNPHNLGLHGNCVRMLKLARGQYVKILMADDVLAPGCLAVLSAALGDPTVTLATSRRRAIDETGNEAPPHLQAIVQNHLTVPVPASGNVDGHEFGNLLLQHQLNFVGEPSTTMFRRSDVDPDDAFWFGGRPYVMALDIALWLRLLAKGCCYYDVHTLSSYRMHAGQVAHMNGQRILDLDEWATMLLDCGPYGFLASDEQRAAAITALLRKITGLPAEDAHQGMGILLRHGSELTRQLAEIHERRGAEACQVVQRLRTRLLSGAEAAEPAAMAAGVG